MTHSKCTCISMVLFVAAYTAMSSTTTTSIPSSSPTKCPGSHLLKTCIGEDSLIAIENTTPRASPLPWENTTHSTICWRMEAVAPIPLGSCEDAMLLNTPFASIEFGQIENGVSLEMWVSNNNGSTFRSRKCSRISNSRCQITTVPCATGEGECNLVGTQLDLSPGEWGEICLIVPGTDWDEALSNKSDTSELCVQRHSPSSLMYQSCVEVMVPDLSSLENTTAPTKSPTPKPSAQPTIPPTNSTVNTTTAAPIKKKKLTLHAYVKEKDGDEDDEDDDSIEFHAQVVVEVGCSATGEPFVCNNPQPVVLVNKGDHENAGRLNWNSVGAKLTIEWLGVEGIESDSTVVEDALKAGGVVMVVADTIAIIIGGTVSPVVAATVAVVRVISFFLEVLFDDEWALVLESWQWTASCDEHTNSPVLRRLPPKHTFNSYASLLGTWGGFYERLTVKIE